MKEKLGNNTFPGQKKSRLKKSAVQVEPCAFPQLQISYTREDIG